MEIQGALKGRTIKMTVIDDIVTSATSESEPRQEFAQCVEAKDGALFVADHQGSMKLTTVKEPGWQLWEKVDNAANSRPMFTDGDGEDWNILDLMETKSRAATMLDNYHRKMVDAENRVEDLERLRLRDEKRRKLYADEIMTLKGEKRDQLNNAVMLSNRHYAVKEEWERIAHEMTNSSSYLDQCKFDALRMDSKILNDPDWAPTGKWSVKYSPDDEPYKAPVSKHLNDLADKQVEKIIEDKPKKMDNWDRIMRGSISS